MPKLANRTQCVGCTACANICPHQCIQMKADEAGFMFPEIVDISKCVSCGVCERICPVLKENGSGGCVTVAYAAFTEDEYTRLHSSSGGIFSELADIVLKNGGLVYGACYDEDATVRHIQINGRAGLRKLQGAKYSQSILGNSFQTIKRALNVGKIVLFSGMPCQVAGLKSFLRMDYENLICIDFVCHGVPSPMVWDKYIHYRAQSDNQGIFPKTINLRNKESGWSHYSYSVEFMYTGGNRYLCKNDNDLFMRLFVGDYILRECCGDCHFKGYDRVSDITLADFWGIWDVDPEMDDDKGTSLILIHTQKGEKLLRTISKNIKCKQVTLEQASYRNQSILKSAVHKESRNAVLKAIAETNFGAAIPIIQEETSKRRRMHNIIEKLVGKLRNGI